MDNLTTEMEAYIHELLREDGSDGGFAPGGGIFLNHPDGYVAHVVIKSVELDQ